MSDDPLESATKGAVEGGLEWSAEKLWDLIRKFRNRELAFVEDRRNIETVQAQKQSAEYKFLSEYLPKGYLRILCQMGLSLRQLQHDKARVKELVGDIHRKYGTTGVHITELVQMGVITELLTRLVRLFTSPSDVQKRLTSFLEQVDFLTLFVRKEDAKLVESKWKLVKLRVDTNPINMMIIFGSGKAKDIVKYIVKKLSMDIRRYLIDVQEDSFQITAFIFSPELRGQLTHWSELIAKHAKPEN